MAASKKKPWKTGISSGHITNLKDSIFVFQYLWVEVTDSDKHTDKHPYGIIYSILLP
jgi:hypothetical protein